MKITLQMEQKLSMTQDLINSIELLSLNGIEVEKFLEEESEDNVIVDYYKKLDDKNFVSYLNNFAKKGRQSYLDKEETISPIDLYYEEGTLKEDLLGQLHTLKLTKKENKIGEYLIESIDESGYLTFDIHICASKLNVETHEVFLVLKKIREFEPKGIGARNLEEFLLLQTDDFILRKIIRFYLEDISKNRFNKVAKELNLSLEELQFYIGELKKLKPKPAFGYGGERDYNPYIIPEIFLEIKDNEIEINIEEKYGNFSINQYYLELLNTDLDEKTREYLKKRLSRALFIIKALDNRNKTIKNVVTTIVEHQKEFFLKDEDLLPLKQEDIARELGISISTVSRVLKGKYLQSSKGVFALKDLLQTEINGNSQAFIKTSIKELIDNEDKKKPLSDSKIVSLLNKNGINIKRRTVSKYRNELKIPATSIRRSNDV